MDLALRDRETVHETEDQAVFLRAMDGIQRQRGRGVRLHHQLLAGPDRPGVQAAGPARRGAALQGARRRRCAAQLIDRWHPDIRADLDVETAVASTDGYSFAEIEELKNLLVMHFMDSDTWNWGWALKQFDINRHELSSRPSRQVGFGSKSLYQSSPKEDDRSRTGAKARAVIVAPTAPCRLPCA